MVLCPYFLMKVRAHLPVIYKQESGGTPPLVHVPGVLALGNTDFPLSPFPLVDPLLVCLVMKGLITPICSFLLSSVSTLLSFFFPGVCSCLLQLPASLFPAIRCEEDLKDSPVDKFICKDNKCKYG